jgi:mannose-1-phosphate guanylyltransferase/mannose-6-phosphate isomerase
MADPVIPVILCGGSGTRLWPMSREDRPKQFLRLTGDDSLLQSTLRRALRAAPARHVVTVTLEEFAGDVAAQYAGVDPAALNHLLCEPAARGTAAAVAFAATHVARVFGRGAVMMVLHADHHIGDEEALSRVIDLAAGAARAGHIMTLGIRPTRPETGYGYIRVGAALEESNVYKVSSFIEKPAAAAAKSYLETGDYLWNSGIFLFAAGAVLEEYARHAPAVLHHIGGTPLAGHYMALPRESFDRAILEKSSRVAVVPCDPAWSDIGTWSNLWDVRGKDGDGNAVAGDAVCARTRNCLVQSQGRLIACAGVEDLVIIDTGDAILIANRKDSEALPALTEMLRKAGRAEIETAKAALRPGSKRKTVA